MSALQEQAIRMIDRLSDNNVVFLIDFMQRFMIPKRQEALSGQTGDIAEHAGLMQELEAMRMKSKPYFPAEFNAEKIWEEAVEEKSGSFDCRK